MAPHGDRTTRVEFELLLLQRLDGASLKLSGQGSYRAAVGTFEMGVQRSIDQALAELEAKMARSVR